MGEELGDAGAKAGDSVGGCSVVRGRVGLRSSLVSSLPPPHSLSSRGWRARGVAGGSVTWLSRESAGEAGMREESEADGGMREARDMLREFDKELEEDGLLGSSSVSPGCFSLHRLRFSSYRRGERE